MARVLEVLRQTDARHDWPAPPVAAPRPFRPDAESVPAEETDVPFIEVGGPRTPPPPAPPAQAPEVAPAPAATGFLQVQFQPLPAVLAPSAPAPARIAPEVVAFHQPAHRVSEQYRRILCELGAQAVADAPQVLLFTAPAPRAGTTTVLLNLAVTYARQAIGQLVLVDTNFQRPAVAERLGLAPAPGLQEVLAGLTPVNEAVREAGHANLHVLTAGTALHGETALLGGEPMRQVLRELRGRFHWVFVDAPAWAGRPEVVALSAACDAVYLVAPHAHAATAEMQEVSRLLPRHGTPLRGRIVTLN